MGRKCVYVLPGNEILREHMAEYLNGAFKLLGDNIIGAQGMQGRDFGHKTGSRHNVQAGI